MKFNWPSTTFDDFYPSAQKLRNYYEDVFEDPRSADPRRFSFDPWYVKDQFNHLKSPVGAFFPEDLAQSFFEHLVNWGRRNLGCQMISPPWMSLYLDGHYQNWHADNPQGPFAFVFSLVPKWSEKNGGRTLLLQPEILNYWQQRDFSLGLEQNDIYKTVLPKWNRLLVFDPRIPHRVEPVREIFDPLKGRLVIHGWFVEPRPQLTGGLKPQALTVFLEDHVNSSLDSMEGIENIKGYVCYRFQIDPKGKVKSVENVVSSLIFQDGNFNKAQQWSKVLSKKLAAFQFKSSKSASTLTLPIQFS